MKALSPSSYVAVEPSKGHVCSYTLPPDKLQRLGREQNQFSCRHYPESVKVRKQRADVILAKH